MTRQYTRKKPLANETPAPDKLGLPPIASLDIETDGLGGEFIYGSILTDQGYTDFSSMGDVFDWIIKHPEYRYLSHNGAGYEFAYLAPFVHEYFLSNDNVEVSTLLQGDSKIVRITIETTVEQDNGRIKKEKIELDDTLCLFSMSLDKVAKAYCPELPKLKGSINFEKEKFDPSNPQHMAYLHRDCEIVYVAYQKFAANVAAVFGSKIGLTAGSTALKAFKTTIPKGHTYYRVHKDVEQFIRECYYGGLVLPGKQLGNVGNIASVDINGAYAYQMREHKYPVGTPYSTDSYHPTDIGFYYVLAEVPRSVFFEVGFNPVPHRDPIQGLSWPTGVFYTYMSTPEIEFARSCGCTIDVQCGYVFPRSEYIFKPFVDKCQEMELAMEGIFKPTIKTIRNSAYGKFGSKDTHKVVRYSRETLPDTTPLMNEDNGKEIEGLYIYEEPQEAEYMLPHWAALVTAYERVYIMGFVREAYRRGAKTVYCDTDSLKADYAVIASMLEDGYIPHGSLYGQFKLEDICDQFIVLGSKCYYGHLDETLMNKHGLNVPVDEENKKKILDFFKAKGIPKRKLDKKLYTSAMKGEFEEKPFISVKSTLSIMKEGSYVRPEERKRKITNIRNSYAWEVDQFGRIIPRSDYSALRGEGCAWGEFQSEEKQDSTYVSGW